MFQTNEKKLDRCRVPIPVVGVDEQVQVAGVHVIHDVLAVGVDHFHVVLHFLLHLERGEIPFAGTAAQCLHSSGNTGTEVIRPNALDC